MSTWCGVMHWSQYYSVKYYIVPFPSGCLLSSEFFFVFSFPQLCGVLCLASRRWAGSRICPVSKVPWSRYELFLSYFIHILYFENFSIQCIRPQMRRCWWDWYRWRSSSFHSQWRYPGLQRNQSGSKTEQVSHMDILLCRCHYLFLWTHCPLHLRNIY